MKYGQQKTRIRRFLRDPDANIWNSAYLLATFNNVQQDMSNRLEALENVEAIKVPPSYAWSYLAEWEWAFVSGTVYKACHEAQQTGFVATQRWEHQQDIGLGVDASDGTMCTHPFEAWTSEKPAQPVPWPFPRDYHATSLLAHDREPLSYIDKTRITNHDTTWKTREGEPIGYYRDDFTNNQFIPYPRPSTIKWETDALDSKAEVYFWMFSYEWEEDYMAALLNPPTAGTVTMGFNLGGVQEPNVGDSISGDSSGFTATIDSITLTSGSWLGEDAAGTMELSSVTGTGSVGENVDDDTEGYNNVLQVTSWTVNAAAAGSAMEVGFGNTFTFYNGATADADKCWYTYEWENGYAGQDQYMRGMWLFEIGLNLDGQRGMVTSIGAEVASAGVITGGGLHTSEEGMTVDAIDDKDNFLLVYRATPPDIQSDADESQWPGWAQKYIECGTLERAFAANTDGRIKSLEAYWRKRYELGLKVVKRWKSRRLQDRHYRLATGVTPPARRKRHARLPDTFPPV